MSVPGDQPVRYASLAGDGSWQSATLDGLRVSADGVLELLTVPALAEPALAAPARIRPSGLALDAACGLYLSSAEDARIVRVGLDCNDRSELSTTGWLERPAGLCVGPFGWLFVADPAGGRIVVLSLPEMTRRDAWKAGLDEPVGLASDGDDGLFVLDAGMRRVLRFDPWARLDSRATDRLAAAREPRAIATAPDRTLYVGDAAARAVLRFRPDGGPAGAPLAAGTLPQALVAGEDVLYVADEGSGEILLFSRSDGRTLGHVEGFRGPVSALALDREERLYIKLGAGDHFALAEPGAARVTQGTVVAGQLDAGEENTWSRVAVEGIAPRGAQIALEVFEADDAAAAPRWSAAPAIDTLLEGRRHLWLRVMLRRDPANPAASPRVFDVRAETEDSYLAYLPAVYSREPKTSDFLRRLLALAKSELGDFELAIERAPRRIHPQTAASDALLRLAAWQGLRVPDGGGVGFVRGLLHELPALYRYRGTRAGVGRFAQIYAGVRPLLFEDFRGRRIWMLDRGSALGFDTGLVADLPDGLALGNSVTGASGPEDASSWGVALFDADAHRFTALVPAAAVPDEENLREVLDAEKPAHTTYHLCLAGPRLRVGLQARLGVDAIVAGPPAGMELDGAARLGLDARVADGADGGPAAVGRRDRFGVETVVG